MTARDHYATYYAYGALDMFGLNVRFRPRLCKNRKEI